MTARLELRSDNVAGAHPRVLEMMVEANGGSGPAYGADQWTARAESWFRDQFGGDTESFLVWNGTGANVASLRAMTRPWHAVITSEHAHIHVDECGAPELLAGVKLIDLPSADAKLTPDQVREAGLHGVGVEHHVQPRVISLTQTTEYGTAYSVAELTAICDVAHDTGLLVHVDGARIANAAATLGQSLRAITRDVGVDVLSFGLTKNGAVGAEAVVFLAPDLARDFRYIRKQGTQLASKMRFLAAQVLALAEDDRWLANATNANAMAGRLADGIRELPGVTITQRVEANAVFAILDAATHAKFAKHADFYVWSESTNEARLMTSWATTEAEIDAFLEAVAER